MSRKIVYTILFVLCGCVSYTQPSKLVSDFYTKYQSPSEQVRQFKNYSLEEQYEIFEFGSHVVHPPAIYLDSPFAEQGAVIVPFLKKKLEATKNELEILDITQIFSRVARLKLYDFTKDTDLMTLLDKKVNNMQGIWKDVAPKYLSEIKSGKLER